MNFKTRDIKEVSLGELWMATAQYKSQSEFGRRLKALRQARGLTQVELAERIGGTQKMITHYENRVKFPPVDIIPKLAKALKVSTDELLGAKPFKDDELVRNKNLMRRFRKFGELPLRDQRALFHFLNVLLKKSNQSKNGTN